MKHTFRVILQLICKYNENVCNPKFLQRNIACKIKNFKFLG